MWSTRGFSIALVFLWIPLAAQASHFKIGPVQGLTTAWHTPPETTAVPLGTTLQLKRYVSPGAAVAWQGAEELTRDGDWSIAECYLADVGRRTVYVRVELPDGTKLTDSVTLDVHAIDVSQITLSPVRVEVAPVGLDASDLNRSTYEHYSGPSIAGLRKLSDTWYRTSIHRTLKLSVEVTPTGFAPLMEWRTPGRAPHLGNTRKIVHGYPHIQQVAVGPVADPRAIFLETYRVGITSHASRRDVVPEGTLVTFRAETIPPGREDEVTWLASTKYGTSDPVMAQGADFTVLFENTWGPFPGLDMPFQWLGVKADHARFNQDQKAPQGGFPASLALDLYDAFGALSTVVSDERGQPDGGRQTLTHILTDFLPAYYRVLDFEISLNNLEPLVPFRDKSEVAIFAEADRLLTEMSDDELNELIFNESELRLFPVDFAVDQGLPARISAETDAQGFLVSSSWALKWLWNKSQSVLGCLAQGIGKLIVKLIGAIHKGLHDAFSTPQPTPTNLATLQEMSDLATLVVGNLDSPDGGRQVVTQVRDRSLPFMDGVLRDGLIAAGQKHLTPFLDTGIAEAGNALDSLLTLPDPELNASVFSDVSLVAVAWATLDAEDGILEAIQLDSPADGTASFASFDLAKWLWDTLLSFIGCIPNLGPLLEKLVGTGHDVLHAQPSNPTSTGSLPLMTLSTLVDEIRALEGHPQRGRRLALFVRDQTLPALQQILDTELVDLGEPHLTQSSAIGISAQQERMTLLLERSDEELNLGLYDDKISVLVYAETFRSVFTADPAAKGTDTSLDAASIWNALIRILKCLSEGRRGGGRLAAKGNDGGGNDSEEGDKLVWILAELHSFLH